MAGTIEKVAGGIRLLLRGRGRWPSKACYNWYTKDVFFVWTRGAGESGRSERRIKATGS